MVFPLTINTLVEGFAIWITLCGSVRLAVALSRCPTVAVFHVTFIGTTGTLPTATRTATTGTETFLSGGWGGGRGDVL